MSPTRRLRQFLDDATLDHAAIDAFIRDHEFPIVEGRTVTFIYRGHGDAVSLRHWVYGLPSQQAFTRVGSTDLWHLTLELPEESRVEYKIEVTHGGHATWIRDPLNPHAARDPYGANSVCHVTGYATPEWVHPDPEARPGRLESLIIESTALRERPRLVEVYVPARLTDLRHRRYLLIVAHDGPRVRPSMPQLRTVLDNLIDRFRRSLRWSSRSLSSPAIASSSTRHDERHARFVVEELLPAARGSGSRCSPGAVRLAA